MPRLSGRVVPVLTVRDPVASAAWYEAVLGLAVRRSFAGPDGRVLDVVLVDEAAGIELCLVAHAANPGDPFDETRTGLDHLELLVEDRDDLAAWARHLDDLAWPHSGVKQAPASRNAMVTFRDPDNIQLEVFWSAPDQGDGGAGAPER